jgi:hypothetical protein
VVVGACGVNFRRKVNGFSQIFTATERRTSFSVFVARQIPGTPLYPSNYIGVAAQRV